MGRHAMGAQGKEPASTRRLDRCEYSVKTPMSAWTSASVAVSGRTAGRNAGWFAGAHGRGRDPHGVPQGAGPAGVPGAAARRRVLARLPCRAALGGLGPRTRACEFAPGARHVATRAAGTRRPRAAGRWSDRRDRRLTRDERCRSLPGARQGRIRRCAVRPRGRSRRCAAGRFRRALGEFCPVAGRTPS